jgi:uncharacterized protein (TIGR04255 family)
MMHEVFPNPTVENVIFQIKYPALMYIENKIGDFQLKIMDKFPESSEIYSRQFMFADIGPDGDMKDVPGSEQKARKIWQFSNPGKYKLDVTTDSLSIDTEFYKTYKAEGCDYKLRDIIEFVLNEFFKIVPIPIIKRIGLRYIDNCPLPQPLNNDTFSNYYNTTFPLDKYSIQSARRMEFRTTVKKQDYYVSYSEIYNIAKDDKVFILDFDGFTENIQAKDCLTVTDELYTLISEEYKSIIKDPVKDIMRKNKEV